MGIKNIKNKKGLHPRDHGYIGLEKVNDVLDGAASIDDRIIISSADPDESLPKPVPKKPIVSVNGEDVDEERAA